MTGLVRSCSDTMVTIDTSPPVLRSQTSPAAITTLVPVTPLSGMTPKDIQCLGNGQGRYRIETSTGDKQVHIYARMNMQVCKGLAHFDILFPIYLVEMQQQQIVHHKVGTWDPSSDSCYGEHLLDGSTILYFKGKELSSDAETCKLTIDAHHQTLTLQIQQGASQQLYVTYVNKKFSFYPRQKESLICSFDLKSHNLTYCNQQGISMSRNITQNGTVDLKKSGSPKWRFLCEKMKIYLLLDSWGFCVDMNQPNHYTCSFGRFNSHDTWQKDSLGGRIVMNIDEDKIREAHLGKKDCSVSDTNGQLSHLSDQQTIDDTVLKGPYNQTLSLAVENQTAALQEALSKLHRSDSAVVPYRHVRARTCTKHSYTLAFRYLIISAVSIVLIYFLYTQFWNDENQDQQANRPCICPTATPLNCSLPYELKKIAGFMAKNFSYYRHFYVERHPRLFWTSLSEKALLKQMTFPDVYIDLSKNPYCQFYVNPSCQKS